MNIILIFIINSCIVVYMGEYMDYIIKIDRLNKVYGQGDTVVEVLKGIDCKIKRGSICTLLGPSGSGKSTMLNIIGGIEEFDGGTVVVDGLSLGQLTKKKISAYRRAKLGFVFQFYNLVPNLTVKENIEVGSYLSNSPMDIDELIDTLGLNNHVRKFPSQLSVGQQQRVSIGRALVKNVDLLLCDEPTGALDYNTAKEVLSLLQEVNRKYGTTIIIATHNTAIVNMSNEVLKLHDGYVLESKTNESVIDAKDLVW